MRIIVRQNHSHGSLCIDPHVGQWIPLLYANRNSERQPSGSNNTSRKAPAVRGLRHVLASAHITTSPRYRRTSRDGPCGISARRYAFIEEMKFSSAGWPYIAFSSTPTPLRAPTRTVQKLPRAMCRIIAPCESLARSSTSRAKLGSAVVQCNGVPCLRVHVVHACGACGACGGCGLACSVPLWRVLDRSAARCSAVIRVLSA